MWWWRTTVLAVGYFVLAGLTALALVVYGSYDCYEECRYDVRSPPWPYDSSAWEWDAIFWLGVSSGIAALLFMVLVFRFEAPAAAIALAAQVALSTAGAVLVLAADEASTSLVAVVLVGLALLGSGLIAARRSLIER